jgi:hypothetical protein
MNKLEGTVWLDVLTLGRGRIEASKLAQVARALGEVLESQSRDLDPNAARLAIRSRFKAWGLSPGAIHSLDHVFMGLLRRAALSGLVAPPPEGPWNSQWQLVIDVAPNGNKAFLKALAGWSFSRGVAACDLTDALLTKWQRERHMTATAAEAVARLLPQLIETAHQATKGTAELMTRLESRSRTGMTRSLLEQYGVRRATASPKASASSNLER